jgi:hypothetical protein
MIKAIYNLIRLEIEISCYSETVFFCLHGHIFVHLSLNEADTIDCACLKRRHSIKLVPWIFECFSNIFCSAFHVGVVYGF